MRALFSGQFIEARTPPTHGVRTFSLQDVEPDAFGDVLTFLYTGELVVTPSTLASVLRAASRLEVGVLLELGAAFLSGTLSPASCIATWEVIG